METLICLTEIEIDRVYFLRFCTKYDTRFSKYGLQQMPQKRNAGVIENASE